MEKTAGSVSSKPAAERGAVYASHLAKVREVIIAACRVEASDLAVGLVTPHTKQMAAESDNFKGKAYSAVDIKELQKAMRVELGPRQDKESSVSTSKPVEKSQ